MVGAWEEYFSPPNAASSYEACRQRHGSSFEHQKSCIRHLVETRAPRTVACLGAGVMNDLPYWTLVEKNTTLHLVDWLPEITEFGVANAILRVSQEASPQCVYCRNSDAALFCTNFRDAENAVDTRTDVCADYQPSPGKPGLCATFSRGRLPVIHRQDVTGGYANAFGAALEDELAGVTSWRQAFKRATSLASGLKLPIEHLDIPDHSIDLVISSMVVSQFEHEPYGSFSKQALNRLGPPNPHEESRLRPAMEKLRDTLLANQVEGHCAEILRLLAPEGRCFMAYEMFHREPGHDRWRMVTEMHQAQGRIARHFDFDFDGVPNPALDPSFENAMGKSVVQHYVMTPRR